MELFGLVWQRPWAFWALALPLLVFLLARHPLRPHRLATGALNLWRSVHESPHGAGGERPKLPLALWWLVIGLSFGVLSLAGPRERSRESSRTWQVIVDRSAAAYLQDSGGDLLRIDAARALLESEWKSSRRSSDTVRWFDGSEWIQSLEFPEAWRSAPLVTAQVPRWLELDLPGAIWLCPVQPAEERLVASLCAGGASHSPGPVAIEGNDRLDWTSSGLLRVVGGAPQRSVSLIGVQGRFADFVSLWAEERGLRLNDSAEGASEILRISVATSEEVVGTERWTASPGLLLLVDEAGPALGSDPADFALSWSQRLDKLSLAPVGFSSVGARALSGPQVWSLGEGPLEEFAGGHSESTWEGWMALLSCLFVAAAMIGAAR